MLSRSFIKILCVVVFISGCTTNPIPKDYKGPIAEIKDSFVVKSDSMTEFYCVTKINGNKIEDSVIETLKANSGRGFQMDPVSIFRKVPAKELLVTIEAQTLYAAPILALTNKTYKVSGDILFTPKKNKYYIVKGVLGEEESAVWIEDKHTGEVVSERVVAK